MLLTSGERVRFTRNLTGHTRTSIAKKHNINLTTIRKWEKSTHLTENALNRIISYLEIEEVVCSKKWLKEGLGEMPHIKGTYVDVPEISTDNDDEQIVSDLINYCANNKNVIDYYVKDNSLSPFYCQGDYVAGIVFENLNPDNFIGLACIVESQDGKKIAGKITNSETIGKYNIASLDKEDSRTLSKEIGVKEIAEIIWHRKKSLVISRVNAYDNN